MDGWSAEAARDATAAIEACYGGAFRDAIRQHDIEGAWRHLERAMRRWPAARRGMPAVPERPHAAAAVRAERPPTAGGGGDAADRAADAALLRLRRLRGLRHAQGRSTEAARRTACATLETLRAADAGHATWATALRALLPDVVLPAALLERAEGDWKAAQAEARARRRAEWRRWVEDAVANRQGKLYRWIRGGGTVEAELVPAGGAAAAASAPGSRQWLLALQGGPAARLRFYEGAWKAIWQRLPAPPVGEEWLHELDGLPPFPERAPWTAEMVGWLLRHMPRRKKPGLDAWTIGELRLLPVELRAWIADLLEEVEESGAWPQELAEPEGLLLPKPGGPPAHLVVADPVSPLGGRACALVLAVARFVGRQRVASRRRRAGMGARPGAGGGGRAVRGDRRGSA